MVDPIITPPAPSADAPAPLSPTVPLNPPMVGVASPFDRIDGQNRDAVLEAIRAWGRGPLRDWTGGWQNALIKWFGDTSNWLDGWNAETVRYVQDVLQSVIDSSIDLQDPVLAGIIENALSESTGVLNSLFTRIENTERVLRILPGAFPTIQAGIDAAHAAGIRRVYLADNGTYWPLTATDYITLPAGMTFDYSAAQVGQSDLATPAVYVPPGSDHVTVVAGTTFLDRPTRPTFAEMPAGNGPVRGSRPIANCSGVMCHAEYVNITGHFEFFRNGVRLGHWDGVTASDAVAQPALRRGNVVNITTHRVDFGVTYFGQDGLNAVVAGTYEHMFNTDDPGHLVYGTVHVDASKNIALTIDAWDSPDGGSVLSLKNNKDVTVSVYGRTVPAVVNLQGMAGDVTFTRLEGYDLLGIMTGADPSAGLYLEPVRSSTLTSPTFYPDLGRKIVKTRMRLQSREFPGTLIRMASLSGGWEFEDAFDIRMNTAKESASATQAALHVYGNDSRITGSGVITNDGSGRVNGINYAAGTTGHLMADAPVMSGVATGIIFGADSGTYVVDPTSIRTTVATDRPYTTPGSPATNTIISKPGKKRQNRYTTFPLGVAAAPVNASLAAGVAYYFPVDMAHPDLFDRIGVDIITAQAGGQIRFALYGPDEIGGIPSRLIADLGAVPTDATGQVETTINRRAWGTVFLVVRAENVSAPVVVSGCHSGAVDYPRLALSVAFTRTASVMSGIPTGAWPATLPAIQSGGTTVPFVTVRSGT